MASRLTDRPEVLVPSCLSEEKRSQLANFARTALTITPVAYDRATGRLDLADLGVRACAHARQDEQGGDHQVLRLGPSHIFSGNVKSEQETRPPIRLAGGFLV